MKFALSQKINLGFGLTLFMLSVIGWVSYRSITELREAAERRKQDQQIITALQNVLSHIQDAEIGWRGYLITGEDRYLEPYYAAVKVVGHKIDSLRYLISDRPGQQGRFNDFESLKTSKFTELEEAIRLRRSRGFEAALQVVQTGHGKQLMDDIRKVIREMAQEEEEAFKQQDMKVKEDIRKTTYVIVFGSLLAFVLVGAASVVIQREISQRRRAEEELDRFFTLSLDMLCIAGFDGRFKRLNPAWERTLGFPLEELLEKPFIEFVHPEDREATLAEAHKLTTGADTISFENRYRCKDGSYKWLMWRATPFMKDRLLYAAARDITERKQAEEELKRAYRDLEEANRKLDETNRAMSSANRDLFRLNRELQQKNESLEEAHRRLKEAQTHLVQSEKMASLGQLVAGIAHEVNNPLAFVSNNVFTVEQTLSRIGPEVEAHLSPASLERLQKLRVYLKDTREGLERVRDLVLKLRTFSRLDEGEFKTVDVHEGLDSVLLFLHHRVKNRIEVEKRYGPDGALSCYAGQLNQVLMNVISNAVDAIEGEGKITVATGQEDGMFVVSVKDTGRGIPEAVRGRIFDPFFTTKPVGQGTGLGLAISYGIIQAHQGAIEVHSEEGQGTEFVIRIPTDIKGEIAS